MKITKSPETLQLIVITFVVTALYDVLLRFMIEGKIPPIFGIENSRWFKSLVQYFERTTLLQAGLVAGFVGAVTMAAIIVSFPYPTLLNKSTWKNSSVYIYLIFYLILTFLYSGISGIIMRKSKLFPVLDNTMYEYLTEYESFYADAASGVVVVITVYGMYSIFT